MKCEGEGTPHQPPGGAFLGGGEWFVQLYWFRTAFQEGVIVFHKILHPQQEGGVLWGQGNVQ